MKNIISIFKKLSVPGVLLVHQKDRKIRIVSSSNFVSSIQRILPELDGSERIEVISEGVEDKKLRSLLCYIHKRRLEGLGYKVKSRVKKWRIDSRAEVIGNEYKWVVRVKNTYSSILVGVFEKEEMDDFLKTYYPCGMISAVVISSNPATRELYKLYPE